MQHSPQARSSPTPATGLEAMRGPRVRARLASSVGVDLIIDGRLRPAIGLKEGSLRGRALSYRLIEADGAKRRLSLASLNTVDAERVDLAVLDAAFAALEPPVPGERPPLMMIPLSWSTLRAEKSRRRLLRRVATGQIDHGVLALCEVVGLEPGVPPAALREAVGALKPIFRGVLARTPSQASVLGHLADCGFTGAAVEADRIDNAEDEAAMLRRVLLLQTIGPGVLIHGVRSVAGLAAARGAGASWASLDIQPGGEPLMAETKTAAGSPRPPQYVDAD
ncbi:hypothetical protein [Caulobacter sp. NIBR1757]|uniref:hypothetical protein n=1 Tax=Caulobacter sp. NIBR1757 TaxID=3016000 RepID=UPI0022F0C283|nr:hypothetical protein [Caulobacter sp. NIBR1757]WGM37342.1 hypothetical protein AMEJIAPC_00240 [Caulobacter sp. NIBR1757]